MVKCACKEKDCKIKINTDEAGGTLWFTNVNGDEDVMYLDANTAVGIIELLQSYLRYLSGDKKE